jgi:pimeloyl-ACP methyl ester carboxylesterase
MIVFVPGIKGSELFEGDNKRWFPSTTKDIDLLDIKNELEANSIIRHVTPYGLTKLTKKIYLGILDEFGESSFSIFAYDWRKSILDHVDGLVSNILREYEAGNKKITLIGHSMGGLLAKAAILKLNDQGHIDKISKFISIGTPWHGSPDSLKALLYGEPGVFSNFSNILQILNAKATRKLAKMFPSVYQLLPSEIYFNHSEGNFIITDDEREISYRDFKTYIQNLHDEDKEKSDFVDIWKDYIDPLHSLIQADLPDEIVHDCLIGYSHPTLYKIPEKSKKGIILKKYKSPSAFKNGDGVVPLHSAIPNHKANLFYVKGEHSELCSASEVLEFIKWSITCGESKGLPLGIIRQTDEQIPVSENLVAGFMARIMCPVESTILDEEGKYVAGVFDTNISEISDLSENEKVKFINIGESKYAYFPEEIPEDLAFEIHAYKEGIAQVSIELFDESYEESKTLRFETIPVNKNKSAKLYIPGKQEVDKAVLEFQGEKIQAKTITRPNKEKVKEISIPKIDVSIVPTGDTKKAPYRNTFSGPVNLVLHSESMDLVDELFYSIDGKEVRKYRDTELLILETGKHVIEVFGRDIYDRVIKPNEVKLFIDDIPPQTMVDLSIDPEGIFIKFIGRSIHTNTKTYYRFLTNDNNKGDWNVTEVDNKISVPSSRIRESKNATIRLEFYTEISDFELKEELQTFEFSLGEIPTLMWEDTSSAVTPNMIWNSLFQMDRWDLSEYKIEKNVQNKYNNIEANDIIGDNVKSIQFSSNLLTIEVYFSERYSLYFSGPPTELLKLDQVYKFSFELRTERGNENIISTNPEARLKAIKAPKGIKDKLLKLTEKDGTFYGSFTVDSNFRHYKHKLVVTDQKNISPPLREIVLILGEEDKD